MVYNWFLRILIERKKENAMHLFESTFRDGYEYFERVFCTDLKKSIKRKVNLTHEWYEPSSRGNYRSILDPEIKLDKKQGRAQDGKDQYGLLDPMYRNIRDNYWGKQDGYNKSPRVWDLDIETRSGINSRGFPIPELALEEVCMVQIFDSDLKQIIMIGVKEWRHKHKYENKFEYPVKYIVASNEKHLFEIYNKLFSTLDPLIIYAWNGDGFDFPYLFNRMKRLGIDVKNMSNYGNVTLKQSEFQGKTEFKFSSDGHFYIDMMVVYKKFVLAPRPSYSLDTIAEIDLKERKVQHTEYVRFDDFYLGKYVIPDNPTEEQLNSDIYQLAVKEGITEEVKELGHSEFCWYSYKDPLLIKKLDDKYSFTDLMISISEKMGVQISDSLGTVKPWAQFISNISILDKQVMPPRQDFAQPDVKGGFVMDPIIGKHQWGIAFDVSSMYPLLSMSGFNMSPETYVSIDKAPPELRDIVLSYYNDQDEIAKIDLPDNVKDKTAELLQEHNFSMGMNGALFDNTKQGIIPRLVQEIYSDRKAAKKVQSKYQDVIIKIQKIQESRL